jgi:thiol-disulfide isomerase/thioredoxin
MKTIIFIMALLCAVKTRGQEAFSVTGKIKSMVPVAISVKTLTGETILTTKIDKASTGFAIGPIALKPDLYVLSIGETKEKVFLTNTAICINGYYDHLDSKQSSLEFNGIEEHLKVVSYGPKRIADTTFNETAFARLTPVQVAAAACFFDSNKFNFNKRVLDKISGTALETGAGKWLVRRVDSLSHYAVGVPAPDFSLVNTQGKKFSLSQFKGKLVVLDCWASWCGPCRKAMAVMKNYYKEFEGKVQFISISVDDVESKWRKAEEEEKIPWLSVWDNTGFKPTSLMRKNYGFNQIPFIAIIGKNGKIISRDIFNSEVLRKELLKLTKD